MDEIITDILVIGSGGAGLRAAISANDANPNLKITIITPGNIGHDSLTATACSDRMAFHVAFDHTPPGGDDAWKAHAADIYIGGAYVSNPNLAALLACKARHAFASLENLHVPWVRNVDGTPRQFLTDGSAYPRACYTGPYTARDIHRALLNDVAARNIPVLENHRLLNWAMPSGNQRFTCVIAFDRTNSTCKNIFTNAVILATGGPGAIFGSPLYPPESDAIPFYLAMLSGAKLVNLEFIQMGLVSPLTKLACSGSMLRALPTVVDETGHEILFDIKLSKKYESYLELLFMKGASWPVSAESPARFIDLKIWGRTHSGIKVFLDFGKNPYDLDETFYSEIISKYWENADPLPYAPTPYDRLRSANPQVIGWFNERDVDLKEELLEVRHEAQHFLGGILINERAETGVPGLYACGECAGGQHGANRPGGNALLDTQVMGTIAGTQAAKYATAKNHPLPFHPKPLAEYPPPAHKHPSNPEYEPHEVMADVISILRKDMGLIRATDSLVRAFHDIEEIAEKGIKADGYHMQDYLSAVAALKVAKGYIWAAWSRGESRGSHICRESEYYPHYLPLYTPPKGRVWFAVRIDNEGETTGRKLRIPAPKVKNA